MGLFGSGRQSKGPEKNNLIKAARENIQFVSGLKSEELIKYYSNCKALIFPGEEDFVIHRILYLV